VVANDEVKDTLPDGVPEAVLATRTYTEVEETEPADWAKVRLVA
jgi:hypothetical protein